MASIYPKYWSVCRIDTADATLVAAGRDSGHVEVWDPGRRQYPQDRPGKGAAPAVCPVRLGGQPVVVSAGVDHTIRLWDPVTRRQMNGYSGHPTARITQLCRLPATGGQPEAVGDDPQCGWVRALATYPSETGPHLLVCGYDKAVNLFTARGDTAFGGF